MRVHRFALSGTDPPDQDRAALLCDAIWAQGHQDLGLEHITVVAAVDRFEVALFFNSAAVASRMSARALVAAACGRSNMVERWFEQSTDSPLDRLDGA